MTQISSANDLPSDLLDQLSGWFESEWGEFDPFDGNHSHIDVPAPVLAIDEHRSLLGGLAFSSFVKPNSESIAVWINMVLVAPSARGKGIASMLVQAAEAEAKQIGIQELLVLSEYPALYEKLGWRLVGLDSEKKESVLNKSL